MSVTPKRIRLGGVIGKLMPDKLSRDSPIVDFGGHIVVNGYVPDFMEPLDDIIGPAHNDPDLVLERYQEAGIDRVVLSQPPYMGYSDFDSVRESNDVLLDVIEDYEEFYGLAAIPTPAGGEEAAAELERCLENGFNGGALETMSDGIELDNPEVGPIFDIAEKYKAPLLVHPKIDVSLHEEVDVLSDKYRLNAIFGREAALSESIFKLVHQDILDDRSDLNLVFHHLGGNIASMLGRAHLHLDIGRWPNQDEVKPFHEFKRILEERVYLDTSGFWGYHAPFRTTLEEFPSSQILFGTDAPYEVRSAGELHDHAKSVAENASKTDADSILGGNTLDLLVNVDN